MDELTAAVQFDTDLAASTHHRLSHGGDSLIGLSCSHRPTGQAQLWRDLVYTLASLARDRGATDNQPVLNWFPRSLISPRPIHLSRTIPHAVQSHFSSSCPRCRCRLSSWLKIGPKRRRNGCAPPKFNSAEVSQVFFTDVFSKLQGERPATPTANAAAERCCNGHGDSGCRTRRHPAGAGGWSKLISSGTIEDEIKAIKLEVDKNVTTPSDFAGRGHKIIRREFSFLAMLFAVIAEYDGEVRFKKDAATARDLFSRTANNTKAGGNTNVFSEAKLRKADLDELLSGSSLPAQPAGETPEWGVIIDRSPLMQRLEAIYQEKVAKSLASKDEFGKHSEEILHEAELISVMATVLTKPGMNDADDQTYAGFANSMKSAASEIVDAVKAEKLRSGPRCRWKN